MTEISIKIKGISSLLMHRFPTEPVEKIEKKSKEEQAEIAAYRDIETKELYIPGIAFQRALVSAATFSKGKGRASLQKETAASIIISPERSSLGVKTYKIDERPVVIPATKGRIIRYRPIFEQWCATFIIEYDPDLMTEKQLREIVDNCGSRVGILDFRPEKKGPFGRFMVVEWTKKK